MKYKQLNVSKDLLNNFLKSQIHITLTKVQLKKNLNSFLYGFRNNLGIFNFFYIFLSLKKFVTLLNCCLRLKNTKQKKLLFFGFPTWFNPYWQKIEKLSNNQLKFLDSNWESFYDLKKNWFEIAFIVVFNDFPETRKLLKQSKDLRIPTIGFITDDSFKFDYPIFGNFRSKQSIFFFFSILLNSLNNKNDLKHKKKNYNVKIKKKV
uniref:Ribosomal protein S2 n=1 Tax=Chattonella marina TaxID=90936 RepID=D2Z1Z5_9STRA|nr:ribosomal protein S2 [Chattonella marina]BAI70559.1 ribosomal protein S2 [Chattonella marina]